MLRTVASTALTILLVAGCGAGVTGTPAPTSAPASEPPSSLTLEPLVDGLDAPLDIAVRPDDPEAMFVAEQVGRIRVVRDGALAERPVLDIAGIVSAGGEQGLLGLAFHPDPNDDRLFIYYTAVDGSQVLSSFMTDPDDPDIASPESEVELLRMADPFGNHNGGSLVFGSDGYLYVGTGDGGAAGDPLDSGRRLDTLLAKVLRLDVAGPGPGGAAYAIPDDNPFVGDANARGEIWATGLRNPWRMRFDRATGDLWIGDVGQGSWEEISVAPAGVGGLDFGWSAMEGSHCYPPGDGDDCRSPDFTLPVTEYGHDEGCSVTGGAVYRGSAQPTLAGRYVFADFCSGRMWTLDAAADGLRAPTFAFDSGRSISAIAEDAAGELYATDLVAGELLRIVATGS